MELYTMIENVGNSGKTFCTRESKIRAGLNFPGDTPMPGLWLLWYFQLPYVHNVTQVPQKTYFSCN